MDSATRSDLSLPQLLAHRARHASDARLALDAGGGLLAALASIVWRPFAWVALASTALCFLCYGAWGIVDRELAARSAGDRGAGARALRVLRVLRATAAAAGGLAFVILVLSALGIALGTWIS